MYVLKTTRTLYQLTLPGPEKIFSTVYVWSSDGWVYDIFSKIRRKYVTTDKSDILQIMEETFKDISISDIQYQEEVQVTQFSEEPAIWSETICGEEELFVQTSTTPPHKKTVRFCRPPPFQES